MVWPVSTDPKKPKQAIEWFRKKIGLTKDEWESLSDEAKRKAFTVAGVAYLDLVTEVWEAMDAAIDEGTTLEDFKASIGDALESAWAGDVDNPPARLEVIFRTNIQSAYMAGRHEQMTDPVVLKAKPMWMFDAIIDGRTSEICEDCDGTILPADDPWWRSKTPPLHHQCRSQVIALSEEQAIEQGGETEKPSRLSADDGFGGVPSDTHEWKPEPDDYPAPLWKAKPDQIAGGK